MKTITQYLIAFLLSLYVTNVMGQDTLQAESKENKLEKVEALKAKIRASEKEALKKEVEAINERVAKKEITYEEAAALKEAAAKKRAQNIENRIAILVNKREFYERNNLNYDRDSKKVKFGITFGDEDSFTGISINTTKKPVKYDIRTSNDLVLAFGLNNAIADGQSLGDSPYKIGGSGFFELGWNWKTRIFKDSNFARVKYGFSFQWNKYDLKDNKYFVQNGDVTTIEQFPSDLKQAKFRTTNLVFPLYFEFGPSEKVEKKDRIRFNTWDKFKVGIGGYGGFNLGAKQKLWYKEGGERIKQKIKQNYNVNPFVYGIGAYIGVGDVSLYAKYDLSETFKDNNVKQNNLSLGLRVDLD